MAEEWELTERELKDLAKQVKQTITEQYKREPSELTKEILQDEKLARERDQGRRVSR